MCLSSGIFVCVSTCHRGRSAVVLPFRVAVSLNCSRLRCRFLPASILSGASVATLFISPKSRAWRAEDSSCDLVLLFRDLVHALRIKASRTLEFKGSERGMVFLGMHTAGNCTPDTIGRTTEVTCCFSRLAGILLWQLPEIQSFPPCSP